MAWQFILDDLTGTQLGEVGNASSRTITLPHLRVPTIGFNVPLWHDLGSALLDTDTVLRAYRIDPVTATKTLAFHGPVVSAEENAEGDQQTIAVTAAGPFWRVAKRIIPGSKLVSGVQYGSAAAPLDLGNIARSVLTDINGTSFTGIDLGTQANSRNGWAGPWWLKNGAEAIAELSAGINSFEFRVRPTEKASYANPLNWPRIGLFDVAPVIGASRPDAIFEYGTARGNVASYKRSINRDTLLTDAIISAQGWPDGVDKDASGNLLYPLIERSDATAVTAHGYYEEVVGDAGVFDNSLRTSIADYHVAVRKNPRQLLTFKPSINARPAPLIDYDVGDTVRARAYVRGNLRFDASFRVWGITFTVDESGNEDVELELVIP